MVSFLSSPRCQMIICPGHGSRPILIYQTLQKCSFCTLGNSFRQGKRITDSQRCKSSLFYLCLCPSPSLNLLGLSKNLWFWGAWFSSVTTPYSDSSSEKEELSFWGHFERGPWPAVCFLFLPLVEIVFSRRKWFSLFVKEKREIQPVEEERMREISSVSFLWWYEVLLPVSRL